MMPKSRQIFKKQKRNLSIAMAVIVLVFLALGWAGMGRRSSPVKQAPPRAIDLPTDKVSPQEIWMTRLEGENKAVHQKLDYIEDLLLKSTKAHEEKGQENIELRREIAKLKGDLREMKERPLPASGAIAVADRQDDLSAVIINQRIEVLEPPVVPVIPCCGPLVEYVLVEPETKVSNVCHSIPAATTVRALLVSSVDAPVGVLCPANPQPVKLRILDDGHLPKGVEVNLKDGLIIGSAYGDLSSERVFMRLERLTLVRADGKYIETQVAGYVSGEDGRYGVRGIVVDKASRMVGNAAAAGVLEGITHLLKAAITAQSVRKSGVNLTNNVAPNGCGWDLLKEGGLCGCSSSSQMLTEYFLAKADQIQPVIQVAAGRIVDVTFTQGAELGDLHTHDRIEEIRDASRRCR